MPSPRQRYENDLKQQGFTTDISQASAVDDFENLYLVLLQRHQYALKSPSRKLSYKLFNAPLTVPKGLYLWGGLGSGKSFMRDNFYVSLPFDNKMREHFHR